jgi:hypothetical protein
MVKCCLKVKAWDVLTIAGIVIGTLGCFLPWGGYTSPFWFPELEPKTGTYFLSGIYALYGFISVAVFQLIFMLNRKVYGVFAVLILGLVALYVSGNWILHPDHFGYGILTPYTVLHGAYVTLLGALIVSGMAFLYIAATAKRQLSLSKSDQRI